MALSLPTTVAIALASIGLFMTVMVMLFQGLRPGRRPYLPFALFCLCFTVYTVLAAVRFQVADPDVARAARLFELLFGFLGMPALIAFACGFVGRWRTFDKIWLGVLGGSVLVYVAAMPTDWLLAREATTRELVFFGHHEWVVDHAMGPLLGVLLLVAVSSPPVVLSILFRAVRDGVSGAVPFLVGVCALSLSGFHDLAVGLDLLPSMYLVGFGFLVMLIAGFVSLAADARRRVTDLSEAYRELQELREVEEQLAQTERLATVGRMLSGVAHELNNPLTAVVGLTEEFPAEQLPPETRSRVELVRREAMRAGSLVRGLLEIVRGEDREHRPVSLRAVVQEVLQLREAAQEEAGIETAVAHHDPDPRIVGDHQQLVQLVLNLVINAEQASAEASAGPRRIWITTGRHDGLLTLSVEDSGPGVPAESQRRVFDPFFTTKRKGEGTGLGLFLAAATAERHGGNLAVANVAGRGARFTLRLPPEPVERRAGAIPLEASLSRPDDAVVSEDLAGLRVAVVDDEEGVAVFLRTALQDRGATVGVAHSGAAALELLTAEAWDVVLCDVIMPDVDGLDLLAWARGEHPGLAERFVFITGDVFGSQLWEISAPPVAPVLQKPFRVRDLLAAIQQVRPR